MMVCEKSSRRHSSCSSVLHQKSRPGAQRNRVIVPWSGGRVMFSWSEPLITRLLGHESITRLLFFDHEIRLQASYSLWNIQPPPPVDTSWLVSCRTMYRVSISDGSRARLWYYTDRTTSAVNTLEILATWCFMSQPSAIVGSKVGGECYNGWVACLSSLF